MFKLMFQGFIWISLLLAMALSFFISQAKRKKWLNWRLFDLREVLPWKKTKLFNIKVFVRICLFIYFPIVFLLVSLGAYPYLAFRAYYSNFQNYQGLDGLQWMAKKYPSSYAIVNYLKNEEPKQVNILEASGDSFTEYSLVSAFSGMPTILGWQVHEWLWRGSWDMPAQRLSEIESIYLNPTSIQSRALLKQYQIKYLVISNREREKYPQLDETGLLSLGQVVWTGSEDELNQDYLILIEK
jgi:hypothetical protein